LIFFHPPEAGWGERRKSTQFNMLESG